MVRFSASILAADLSKLEKEIKRVEPYIDEIHLDVMDGHFVPNLTFAYPIFEAVKSSTQLPIDVHLMVTNPEFHVEKFLQLGVSRITVHVEACTHLHRTIWQIKEVGSEAFVSLNPATPVSLLEQIIGDVDGVLVMSVNPGFSGQKFIAKSLEKIRKLHEWKERYGLDFYIAVDGGINELTAHPVVDAGANILVMGYGIFKNDNLKALSDNFRK
ncbi:ribulose-phosphate 3-epimerase [Thermosipho ferrireducens]|uniref:Ribulose-phosphate 3-epimerase n=1 Tax=Thermosipho ferrireducens TaxID=2571116 RepID=A0ABX7S5D3_9BACT|nr:ribulose-phosphate 3-epimerase [Thermosipho ferrireducens]QTA37736.1 ribulose-phosphate 3-epimerase [Thermosipho ferrireducens]